MSTQAGDRQDEAPPWDVEASPADAPGGRAAIGDLAVAFDDAIAHDVEAIDRAVSALRSVPGVETVFRQDRALLLLWAPDVKAATVDAALRAWWAAEHPEPEPPPGDTGAESPIGAGVFDEAIFSGQLEGVLLVGLEAGLALPAVRPAVHARWEFLVAAAPERFAVPIDGYWERAGR